MPEKFIEKQPTSYQHSKLVTETLRNQQRLITEGTDWFQTLDGY